MTLSEAISSVRITEVWAGLGGGPLRHGRGRAFWRDGDGFNIALEDRKNAWCDHAHGSGGGVLDLIQKALGCDRSSAIAWLGSTFSLEIDHARPLTAFEKRRWAQAREKAKRFLAWRETALEDLRIRRNFHLQHYHLAASKILTHGLHHHMAEVWMDGHDFHERRYQALDEEIDRLAVAPFEALMPEFERRIA